MTCPVRGWMKAHGWVWTNDGWLDGEVHALASEMARDGCFGSLTELPDNIGARTGLLILFGVVHSALNTNWLCDKGLLMLVHEHNTEVVVYIVCCGCSEWVFKCCATVSDDSTTQCWFTYYWFK